MSAITLERARAYCASKKGVTEDFPFDQTTLVFKVGGKIFALTNITPGTLSINLKCDPGLSMILRSRYEEVTPGYHMNKKHWNTVLIDGAIPEKELWMMIDHSYDLVFRGLKKAERKRIGGEG
ncbi:MAG: MmcQ/YjbR family DNA-binding protein [Chrysiogenales bacterium]|nr:MAG: MmcQ/YjbR family DNA-binding protein [Chrysiogenales bacterium]